MFDAMSSAGKTPLLAGYRAVSELTGMGAVGIGSVAYDIDITWYSGDATVMFLLLRFRQMESRWTSLLMLTRLLCLRVTTVERIT